MKQHDDSTAPSSVPGATPGMFRSWREAALAFVPVALFWLAAVLLLMLC